MVIVVYYDLIYVLQGKVFTTVQKFVVSKIFFIFLNKINTFNEQGYIELIKNDCKYTYNVTKD